MANWVISGWLSRTDGARLGDSLDDFGALMDHSPILSMFEDRARLASHGEDRAEIFLAEKPDADWLARLLAAADLADWEHDIAEVADKDWVAESQKLLAPEIAGRFVIHGSHDRDNLPVGKIPLEIEAAQAFGTGKHESTRACLVHLDESDTWAPAAPQNIIDLGTGSGVLAMAAAKIWGSARIIATDIDPLAVEVAQDNSSLNGLAPVDAGQVGIHYLVADGCDHPTIQAQKPYDLIIANILAAPLIELAPDITAIAAPQADLILAGLLATQADDVLAAYKAQGFKLAHRINDGEWSGLRLKQQG